MRPWCVGHGQDRLPFLKTNGQSDVNRRNGSVSSCYEGGRSCAGHRAGDKVRPLGSPRREVKEPYADPASPGCCALASLAMARLGLRRDPLCHCRRPGSLLRLIASIADVWSGSRMEAQRGPRNVWCWGQSGPQFRATGGQLVANSRRSCVSFCAFNDPHSLLRSWPG